jgi:hypothetical protein
LYVTGYLHFFNIDTEDCKYTSFNYNFSGYKPLYDPRLAYLDRGIHNELNNLVTDVNSFISQVVTNTNDAERSTRIHFVDVSPSFNGHRWCEDENVHEPAPEYQDTHFFLSSWPDVDIEAPLNPDPSNFPPASLLASSKGAALNDKHELNAIMNEGFVNLLDGATCRAALGTDPDPHAVYLCH